MFEMIMIVCCAKILTTEHTWFIAIVVICRGAGCGRRCGSRGGCGGRSRCNLTGRNVCELLYELRDGGIGEHWTNRRHEAGVSKH